MKQLFFTLLLVFSASVFAKTYLCTQRSHSSVSFVEESTYIFEEKPTDNITKVVIDLKNKVLKLRVLDNSSATFWDLYNIINQTDDKDWFVILATKSDVERYTHISSLILKDSKKYNEVELTQNDMQFFGSITYRFKCSRE